VILSGDAADALDEQEPGASRFFYVARPERGEKDAGLDSARNSHNTVKPIALLRRLIRVHAGHRDGEVIDMFAGSGSTGCAAALEGHPFTGIELVDAYAEAACRRIRYWPASRPSPLPGVSPGRNAGAGGTRVGASGVSAMWQPPADSRVTCGDVEKRLAVLNRADSKEPACRLRCFPLALSGILGACSSTTPHKTSCSLRSRPVTGHGSVTSWSLMTSTLWMPESGAPNACQ
jgi:hypothetical protein